MSLGDFDASTVVYGKFTTYQPSTGASFTLGGTPALSVYKDNSTTQSTTGVTLTADFDSVTGLNHFAIDTSADGTFYSAGSFFSVVITTGTVDGVSVTGAVVAEFTLRKTSALKPTTAGRTLDVSAGGEAGLDWANIGSPTTAQNLSGTNIDVDQVVASVSGAVGSVTGNVGGNVTGSVGSVATGGIAAASFAAGAIDAAAIAANAIGASELATDAVAEIATAVWAESARTLTAIDEDSTTLDLDATIRGAVGLASANLDTQLDALPTAAENATAVWGAGTRSLTILDEDSTTLDLDATIRAAVGLASANLDTQLTAIDDAVDTEAAAIKAVTDKLDNTLELTSDGYIFTANALQQAPTGSAPTAAEIADAVWEEAIADHSGTAGSTAEALAAAGSAGDPWATALPGAYGSGTAGKIIGDNINATISSRATQTSVDDLPTNAELATALGTADDAVLAQVALVKAVTDKLDDTVELTSDGYIFTVNALQQAPTDGSPTASAIADEVQTRTIAAVTMVNGLAANTVNASALAADAVTEIQSGLSTLNAAGVRTAIGLASANLDAQLDALPTATENADALLNRDMSAVSDTNARSPLNALRFLRNKWGVSGTTLTVTKENDSTEAWTATVTAAPGADPISGSDPA